MSIETAIAETAIAETAIDETEIDETAIDETRAEQASEDGSGAAVDHVLRIVNDSAVGVLLSIAFQAGLLDALRDLPPATSQQVADAAGLDERYVREILHGLLTAGLVVEDAGRYRLGDEYVPFLTGTGVDNLARMARYLTLMGEATRKVVEKVASGGGLGYDEYPMFNQWQAEESAAVNDASLVDVIIPVAGVEERLVAGADVADIGCGAGQRSTCSRGPTRGADSRASTSPTRRSRPLEPRPRPGGCRTLASRCWTSRPGMPRGSSTSSPRST